MRAIGKINRPALLAAGVITIGIVLLSACAGPAQMGSDQMQGMMGGDMMGGGMMTNMPEPMMVWQQGKGPVSSPADAAQLALEAVRSRGWSQLTVDEVHVFSDFYEVEFNDAGGYKGPEVYVNRSSGAAGPEMGPNTMWDTVYGTMTSGGGPELSQSDARAIAAEYLSQAPNSEGLALGDAERHHGYWEFELKQNGQSTNQINVNDFTRAVMDERMWQPDMESTYAPNG